MLASQTDTVVRMLYFVYASLFFPTSNEKEIRAILGDHKIVARYLNLYIVRARNADVRKKAHGARFIYRILKLQSHGAVEESDYLGSVKRVLEGSRIADKRLKIECIDILSRRDNSAKDIEVFLGQSLEKKGAMVDIISPEVLCYIILFRMECYIGFMPYSQMRFVDPGRHYKQLSNGISRAEFKIMQAIDEFGIKAQKGVVLDIGAAPGGWASHLAKSGMKVIAVDKGALDYDRLSELGISACVVEDSALIKDEIKRFDIVHVRSGFGSVNPEDIPTLSLMMCDMNVSPEETSRALLMFSRRLRKGGKALATIKCTTKNIQNYVRIAVKALDGEFTVDAVKVLPSNRQEATLFAKKK